LNELILNENLKVDKVVIGIGGTAVTDLGLGACSRLGIDFIDLDGKINNIIPKNFNQIEKIVRSENPLKFRLELVLDVDNPLLGKNGAPQTFGMQKGLTFEEVKFVEEGFINILSKLNVDEEKTHSLSGAGGGLAAGLQLFFEAGTKSSVDFIVKDLGINFEKDKFDLIITGEGKFDEQSLHSKGTMVVINQFAKSDAAKFIICGKSTIEETLKKDIQIIEISKFFNSEAESIKYYNIGIESAVKQIVDKIFDLKL
jgi:glycerate kinase